jgi:hypothetical protein
VLQGDADQNVPPDGTRDSVSKMKQLGMESVYAEIKGRDHSLFISENRDAQSKIFSFLTLFRRTSVCDELRVVGVHRLPLRSKIACSRRCRRVNVKRRG